MTDTTNNTYNNDTDIHTDELGSNFTDDSIVFDDQNDDVEFEELDWVGDEKKDKEKLKNLRTDLKQSQTESKEHLIALQRARADYVNLKKELDETREVIRKKTTEKVIADFFPILDSFDMAMGNSDVWNTVDKNWRMGIEYIYNQFIAVLENHGITPINTTGVEFDTHFHDPIETKETDDVALDDTIERVIQKGYKMFDKAIRPAKVIVWKKK